MYNAFNGGNAFSSPLSSSNPLYYNSTPSISSLDQSLMDSYNKLEYLKQKQALLQNNPQARQQITTVFTDIANETSDMGEDEMSFVAASPEYQRLYAKHQQEFSEFITAKFANEYIQAGNGRTLEELLGVIRKRREQYKSKFAEDITEIKNKNVELANKNDDLAKTNLELQKQLEEIQKRLANNG